MVNPKLMRFSLIVVMAAVAGGAAARAETQTTTTVTKETTIDKPSGASISVHHEAIFGDDLTETAIMVKKAPPELKEEVIRVETKPDESAVWVAGYWQWDAAKDTYEWTSGSWRRGIPKNEWHPGRWDKFDGGYVRHAGYWAPKSEMKLVVVRDAPPVLREDPRSESPGADAVWVTGYWTNDKNEYVWHSGKWDKPPVEKMTWRPSRWIHTSEGYENIPGYWDYPTEGRTYSVTIKK